MDWKKVFTLILCMLPSIVYGVIVGMGILLSFGYYGNSVSLMYYANPKLIYLYLFEIVIFVISIRIGYGFSK